MEFFFVMQMFSRLPRFVNLDQPWWPSLSSATSSASPWPALPPRPPSSPSPLAASPPPPPFFQAPPFRGETHFVLAKVKITRLVHITVIVIVTYMSAIYWKTMSQGRWQNELYGKTEMVSRVRLCRYSWGHLVVPYTEELISRLFLVENSIWQLFWDRVDPWPAAGCFSRPLSLLY